ncbi:hypothetical protein ACFOOM_00605 [Streptomyces echinoruber]|uniref:hypothetical protein n=1 Tax=Streptomyces echinoruber TaxID=68898 RepID=UPI00167C3269|nr:hypothetical protein [Streptomyces echinoruber]
MLSVAWWVRRRASRRLDAALADFEIDPYHAVYTTGWTTDVDRAAAAALIVDGLARIDSEGGITLTERGAEPMNTPEHPLPAALLDTLRRTETPTYLRRLTSESGYRERRENFLSRQQARVPVWPAEDKTDTLFRTATLSLLALSLFYAVQLWWLTGAAFQGWREFLAGLITTPLLGLLIAVPLVLLAVGLWVGVPDVFRQHCARLPEHPAMQALDEDQSLALHRSATHKEPWERREETWSDTGTDTF